MVIFNGRPLTDAVTLGSAGVSDQDLLLVTTPAGAAAAVSLSTTTLAFPCRSDLSRGLLVNCGLFLGDSGGNTC